MKTIKHVDILIFTILLSILTSCNKDDYITKDDIQTSNGYIKGTLSGTTNDSTKINEEFNLEYSAPGANSFYPLYYSSDTVNFYTVNNHATYINNDYQFEIEINIYEIDNKVKITLFYLSLVKTLDDNKYLNLNLNNEEHLEITEFNYNTSSKRMTGKISGYFVYDRYYDNETEENKDNKFNINLEFDVKAWEIVNVED